MSTSLKSSQYFRENIEPKVSNADANNIAHKLIIRLMLLMPVAQWLIDFSRYWVWGIIFLWLIFFVCCILIVMTENARRHAYTMLQHIENTMQRSEVNVTTLYNIKRLLSWENYSYIRLIGKYDTIYHHYLQFLYLDICSILWISTVEWYQKYTPYKLIQTIQTIPLPNSGYQAMGYTQTDKNISLSWQEYIDTLSQELKKIEKIQLDTNLSSIILHVVMLGVAIVILIPLWITIIQLMIISSSGQILIIFSFMVMMMAMPLAIRTITIVIKKIQAINLSQSYREALSSLSNIYHSKNREITDIEDILTATQSILKIVTLIQKNIRWNFLYNKTSKQSLSDFAQVTTTMSLVFLENLKKDLIHHMEEKKKILESQKQLLAESNMDIYDGFIFRLDKQVEQFKSLEKVLVSI